MKHFVTMEVTVGPSEEFDNAGSESQHIINELGWITGDNLSCDQIETFPMYTKEEFIEEFVKAMWNSYNRNDEGDYEAFAAFSGIVEGYWFGLWEHSDGDGIYVARYGNVYDYQNCEEEDDFGGLVEYYPEEEFPITQEQIMEQAWFALEMIDPSIIESPELAEKKALEV